MTSVACSSGSSASSDAERVRRLLGRAPHAGFEVSVRCPHGAPAVIRNAPRDRDGNPFPTRDWLACRALVDAVSRLEAAGGVRELERDPEMAGPLAEAQRRHAALHAGHNVAGVADPLRVKCLHAHLAFALAEGGGPVADWIAARAGARWPERCCLDEAGPDG